MKWRVRLINRSLIVTSLRFRRSGRLERSPEAVIHYITELLLRVVNSCQVIMQVLSMFFACNSSLRFFQAPNRRKKTNQQLPPKAKARKRHLSFLQFRTLFHSIAGLQFCWNVCPGEGIWRLSTRCGWCGGRWKSEERRWREDSWWWKKRKWYSEWW